MLWHKRLITDVWTLKKYRWFDFMDNLTKLHPQEQITYNELCQAIEASNNAQHAKLLRDLYLYDDVSQADNAYAPRQAFVAPPPLVENITSGASYVKRHFGHTSLFRQLSDEMLEPILRNYFDQDNINSALRADDALCELVKRAQTLRQIFDMNPNWLPLLIAVSKHVLPPRNNTDLFYVESDSYQSIKEAVAHAAKGVKMNMHLPLVDIVVFDPSATHDQRLERFDRLLAKTFGSNDKYVELLPETSVALNWMGDDAKRTLLLQKLEKDKDVRARFLANTEIMRSEYFLDLDQLVERLSNQRSYTDKPIDLSPTVSEELLFWRDIAKNCGCNSQDDLKTFADLGVKSFDTLLKMLNPSTQFLYNKDNVAKCATFYDSLPEKVRNTLITLMTA